MVTLPETFNESLTCTADESLLAIVLVTKSVNVPA